MPIMTLHVPPALTYVLIVLVLVIGGVYWPDAEGLRVDHSAPCYV